MNFETKTTHNIVAVLGRDGQDPSVDLSISVDLLGVRLAYKLRSILIPVNSDDHSGWVTAHQGSFALVCRYDVERLKIITKVLLACISFEATGIVLHSI